LPRVDRQAANGIVVFVSAGVILVLVVVVVVGDMIPTRK
jgi:hypothetical protein